MSAWEEATVFTRRMSYNSKEFPEIRHIFCNTVHANFVVFRYLDCDLLTSVVFRYLDCDLLTS
jgi:hypothetical protein